MNVCICPYSADEKSLDSCLSVFPVMRSVFNHLIVFI